MKTKTFLWLFLVGFSVLFASCSTNNVESVVPDNAVMVMKIDCKSLLTKAEIDEAQQQQLLSLVKELDQDVRKQADKLITDPMSFGVDLSQPIYAFIPKFDLEEVPAFFMAFAVKDADKLCASLKDLSNDMLVKNQGDYNLVYEDDDLVGIYNNDVALVGMFDGDQSRACRMLQLDEKYSFFASDNAKLLQSLDGEVVLFTDLSKLYENIQTDEILADIMSDIIGKGAEYYDWSSVEKKIENLKLGVTLSFEDKGVMALHVKAFTGMEDIILPEQKIATDQLDLVPSKNLLGVALMSIDGKPIADILRQTWARQDTPDESYDMVTSLLSNMQGSILVAANGTSEDDLSALMLAPIPENAIRSTFGFLYDGLVGEAEREGIKIGGKDGYTYMALNREMKTYGASAIDNANIAGASDYFVYAYVDVPKALKFYESVDSYMPIPSRIRNMCASAELKMPAVGECSLVLTMNTEGNALAFLVDELLDLAD